MIETLCVHSEVPSQCPLCVSAGQVLTTPTSVIQDVTTLSEAGGVGGHSGESPPSSLVGSKEQEHLQVQEKEQRPGLFTHLILGGQQIDQMAAQAGRREWCVPGLIPPGLTLLGGQPKLGKTQLALNLAWNVASGNNTLGNVLTHQGDVLFVAAETGAAELKDRADEAWPDEVWPNSLSVIPMDVLKDVGSQPLYPIFEEWYVQAERPSLLIMDTFTALIALRQEEQSGRAQTMDYKALRPFVQWASLRNVAILVLHHTNQRTLEKGEDWANSLAGTSGLVGAVDTVMLFRREREEGLELLAKGRYLPESQWTVVTRGRNHELYDPVKATERLGDRMKAILDAIAAEGGECDISTVERKTGMKKPTVQSYLHRLVQRDVLVRMERGWYKLQGF